MTIRQAGLSFDDSLELKKKDAYISLKKVVCCRILIDQLVMSLYENSIIM